VIAAKSWLNIFSQIGMMAEFFTKPLLGSLFQELMLVEAVYLNIQRNIITLEAH